MWSACESEDLPIVSDTPCPTVCHLVEWVRDPIGEHFEPGSKQGLVSVIRALVGWYAISDEHRRTI